MPGREGVLVDERQPGIAHLGQFAQPKTEQDPLLHPGVHHPTAVDLFRRADLALCERVAELEESFACLGLLLDLAHQSEPFNGTLQGLHVAESIKEACGSIAEPAISALLPMERRASP